MALRLEQEKDTMFLFVIGVVLAFLLLTYDAQYSTVFLFLLGLDIGFWILFQNIKFKTGFARKPIANHLINYLFAGTLGYGVYLFLATIVGMFVSPSAIGGFSSVIQLMAENAPLLFGSPAVTFIAYAILTPIIETDLFFGRLNEMAGDFLKINTNFDLKNIRLWTLSIIIAGVFTYFHLQTKLTTNPVALAFVFVFGIVSCWMVYYHRRTSEAIMLHIIANSIVMLSVLNLIAI